MKLLKSFYKNNPLVFAILISVLVLVWLAVAENRLSNNTYTIAGTKTVKEKVTPTSKPRITVTPTTKRIYPTSTPRMIYPTATPKVVITTMPTSTNSQGGYKTAFIPCVLSTGTYNVTFDTCKEMKIRDEQHQKDLQKIRDDYKNSETYQNSTEYQNNPTPIQEQTAYDSEKCVAEARRTYDQLVQSANAQFGGGNSAGRAMIEIATNDFNNAVANCRS